MQCLVRETKCLYILLVSVHAYTLVYIEQFEKSTLTKDPFKDAASSSTKGASKSLTSSSSKGASNNLPKNTSNSSTKAASSSPTDLEKNLLHIERFVIPGQRQTIEFLISAIIPPGEVEHKSISDIFTKIEGAHTREKAVEIFRMVLSFLNLEGLVADVEEKSSVEVDQNVLDKISFRIRLLQLLNDDELYEPARLPKFVEQFEQRELGAPRETIKSPVQLLQLLLYSGVISYETADASLTLIKKKLDKANSK